MIGVSSPIGAIILVVVLLGLIYYMISGRLKPSLPGLKSASSRRGSRSWFEVMLAMFALANLAASPTVIGHVHAPQIAVGLSVLAFLSAFLPFGDLLIVIIGLVAAGLDTSDLYGSGMVVVVIVIAAFLSWIHGLPSLLGGRKEA